MEDTTEFIAPSYTTATSTPTSFTAPNYTVLPTSWGTDLGTGSDAGMRWRTFQLASDAGLAGTIADAELALAGQKGTRIHDGSVSPYLATPSDSTSPSNVTLSGASARLCTLARRRSNRRRLFLGDYCQDIAALQFVLSQRRQN